MISSFKSYLIEEEKVVYFTFGRMNPPTIGHEKLLNKLASASRSNPYRVYLSQSSDPKKNPLDYKSKVKYARKMFPKHARSIMIDTKVKNVFDIATKLYDEGFKKIVMVVGSDRTTEFETLLNKYNGKQGRHGLYNFQGIDVVSAGDRDPDAEGASGMSASKMRKAASEDDFPTFAQGLPKTIKNNDAKAIYNDVRKGMGLKEQTEFKNHVQLETTETREQFIAGKYQVGEQVVIKETDVVATIVRRGSNYLIVESNGQVMRKWIDAVEAISEYKYEEGTPEATRHAKKMTPGQSEARQDPDIGDRKGAQPANYFKGIKSKATKAKRDAQFKKQAKMDDDDPAAYKPAPGDASAKTKPSKHTKKFKQMFGDD
jgi:hypothetical protein